MTLDDPINAKKRRLSQFFLTTAWLQKVLVEVSRIGIYAALVVTLMLVGWHLRETISPLLSIAGFAAVVFLIAVIMPLANLRLHGGLVDTLYYSVAIIATLIIFTANGNERAVNKVNLELEEKQQSLALARDRLSEIETAHRLSEDHLSKTREEIDDAKTAMAATWVEELLSVEAELSTDMVGDLGLDWLIAYLPQRLSRCNAFREQLLSLYAQTSILEMERSFSIGIALGELARAREFVDSDLLLQAEIYWVLGNLFNCEKFQRPAEQLLLKAPGSYARLIELVAVSELLDSPLRVAVEDPQTTDQLAQIEALEEIRRNRDLLTGKLNELEIRVKEAREALAVGNTDITTIELELATVLEDLSSLKTAPLTGLVALAKDWGDRIWPYLLIAMLGMKLARKPMLAL